MICEYLVSVCRRIQVKPNPNGKVRHGFHNTDTQQTMAFNVKRATDRFIHCSFPNRLR
ncbi:MAG: hypothetical protein HRU40_10190 [Saprospiraceae bacterium]|nr:hypothetical protein [Saprospiraceae bacterium]